MTNYEELLKELDRDFADTRNYYRVIGTGTVIDRPRVNNPLSQAAAAAIRKLQAEADKAYANGLEDAAKCCDAEALHCHDNAALAIMGSSDPYDIYMNGSSGAAMALADEIRALIQKDEVFK